MSQTSSSEKRYIGVDVGGTKIQATLITSSGKIIGGIRRETPRNVAPEMTQSVIEEAILELLANQSLGLKHISGVGIAVPGVVLQETGFVVVTPNMNLSGFDLGCRMKDRLNVPVAVGNDGNLGTLGECWLGSARNVDSAVGIFVGTGIGAGIVLDRRVWSGAAQGAAEIGHIVAKTPVENWRLSLGLKKNEKSGKEPPDFFKCGCGNLGCFESYASRTAIERFIREAVKSGAKSCITELCDANLSVIKSGAIAKALKANDKVVTAIMQYSAQIIGYACLTVRHMLDPEVIILGGGVIEACQQFMMPIIDSVITSDKLPVAETTRRILVSSLGDNAVVMGGVALVRSMNGANPLRQSRQNLPKYPNLRMMTNSVVHIADDPYSTDFYILPSGQIQPRTHLDKKNPDRFRLRDLQVIANEGVDLILFATSAPNNENVLSKKCHEFLYRRGIDYRILSQTEAVEVYNSVAARKSAIFHF
ncbi:MAG: ROK family protein [Thermoguttaceae bacterium]